MLYPEQSITLYNQATKLPDPVVRVRNLESGRMFLYCLETSIFYAKFRILNS